MVVLRSRSFIVFVGVGGDGGVDRLKFRVNGKNCPG